MGGLDVDGSTTRAWAQRGRARPTTNEESHKVYDVNVVGMVRVARAALPFLRESSSSRDREHVFSCGDGRNPEPGALQRVEGRRDVLTLAMAADHVRRGRARQLRLPRARPTRPGSGICSTPPTTRGRGAPLEARQPMGRLVSAGRVAEAIAYLASSSKAWRPVPRCSWTAGMRGCGCGSGRPARASNRATEGAARA